MIIGLTGGMGVGKSTAIELLKEKFGSDNIILVKFASPLYQIQEYIYNLISPVYQRPADFIKDRKLLQYLGTDWGRDQISDSIWIDLWTEQVKKIKEQDSNKIIISDDTRFDNEGQAVKSLGGILIKITSTHALDRISTANGYNNHASESGIDNKYVDYTIQNDHTLESYKEKLYSLYDSLQVEQNNKMKK